MGKVVAAPDTRNSPITAAYVVRHSGQTTFEARERRVAEIEDDRERERRAGEEIPGNALAHGRPRRRARPATSSSASANQIAPKIATGIPRTVAKRLAKTCVQLSVALTSQKLT